MSRWAVLGIVAVVVVLVVLVYRAGLSAGETAAVVLATGGVAEASRRLKITQRRLRRRKAQEQREVAAHAREADEALAEELSMSQAQRLRQEAERWR